MLESLKKIVTKYKIQLIFGVGAIVLSFFCWNLYKTNDKANTPYEVKKIDAGFAKYISAFTSGIISKKSTINIVLTESNAGFTTPNQEADASLFSFSPQLKGKAVWINANTISFIPEKELEEGENYEVSFDLEKIAKVEESKFKKFDFSFSVINQFYEVNEIGLVSDGQEKYNFEGSFFLADVGENAEIEKMIAVKGLDGFSIEWKHSENSNEHSFVIKNIPRKEAEYVMTIDYNGKPIHVENNYKSEISIPRLGDFKVMSAQGISGDDQYFSIRFSDELDAKQILDGLFKIGYYEEIKYVINGNELKIHLPYYESDEYKIEYFAGIKNIFGNKISQNGNFNIYFNYPKPSVEMLGEGTIIPSSQGAIIPFEAINLQSVQVKIVKIFENNIPQFFQVNEIDGKQEMYRVGRPVAIKTIYLSKFGKMNLMQKNLFTLNLTEFIKPEPGAIYQVTIGFGKKDVVFICDKNNKIESNTKSILEKNQQNEGFVQGYDELSNYYYDDEYSEDYSWTDRNNPCTNSFYTNSRFPTRNILYSDLGIIAKRGANNDISVFVTDLNSADPTKGVEIECYNYQQQLISKASTDGNGVAQISSSQRPYLIIAKNGNQKGYLKVDEATSNSISNFDVKGSENYQGLKGLVYGERGVWRPGDSLFLTFILEDKLKSFPESHPVSMELINPQGKVVQRLIKTATKGMFLFKCATNVDAPTGNWQAKVKAGGATFTKNIKIETVKPNRLKMELDFGKARLSAKDKNLNGKLKVNWLHGALGAGLNVSYDLFFTKSTPVFKGLVNYIFDNPNVRIEFEKQNLFEGKTNADGLASIPLNLELKGEMPAALNAIFKGKAFEPGGDFSIDNFSLPYYPYTSYVGIQNPLDDRKTMLETDVENQLSFININPEGEPLANRKIKVAIYKLEWRYWWEVENSESNYESDSYLATAYEQDIFTETNGKAVFNFKIPHNDWGRYLIKAIDTESGHSASQMVYIDWSYEERNTRSGGSNATLLSVYSDKEKYNIGEKIKIKFPGGGKAKALISIENGSKVIETYWTDASKERNEFVFEAKEGMSPNLYAHVTLIQPYKDKNNDIPLRMYGIASIGIEDAKTHLVPIITMPEKLKPEQNVSIQISEKDKRPMTFTVAVVDEGLLDITKYKTPNVWEHFNAKEALGVRTWDMYSKVFGGFTGKMERMLSIGGDAALNKKNTDPNSQRFKPVVKFFGPFYSDGTAKTVTFKMPNYVGSVKTMVVASNEGAYGTAEKSTEVNQPMMALATLPRVLGINEEVVIPVNIFVTDPKVKNVTTSIKISGPVQLMGAAPQNTSFVSKGSKMAYFKIKTSEKIGTVKLKIESQSGGYTSTNDLSIEVRSSSLPIVSIADIAIEPNETWKNNVLPLGITGTNKASIVISNAPSINLTARLQYLIQYPHGCLEQTTSSVFPQLYLAEIMDIQTEKSKIEQNINIGIKKLQGFQLPDGSFAYWQGGLQGDEWATNYAGHFLLEARLKGFDVPQNMIEKFIGYQKRMSTAWANPKTDFIQAYRLYTLSLAKSADEGAMNRMRESNQISPNAKFRLAAAYAESGRNEAATSLINSPLNLEEDFNDFSNTYGSSERNLAMMLETFVIINDKNKALEAYKAVVEKLNNGSFWMSTQTTAYNLMAASKFIKKYLSAKNDPLAYGLTQNNKLSQVKSNLSMAQSELPNADMPINLALKNNSKSILYAKIIRNGISRQGNEKDEQNNLELKIKYKSVNGKEITPDNLSQGTSFVAEVTVSNRSSLQEKMNNIALTQIFPSGWEIVNNRLDNTQNLFETSSYDNLEIRDDRVNTYFSLKPNETKVFKVSLNASYEGKYYLPMVNCESMYDNTTYARKAGKWVNVIKR